MINIEDRTFVYPGQLIGDDIRFDSNCFAEGGKVYSAVNGLARVKGNAVEVIPSTGRYMPKEGDVVIGVVEEFQTAGWVVDINSPYTCFMRASELNKNSDRRVDEKEYAPGEVISAKVLTVNEVNDSNLTRPWKLDGGCIINIDPKRVPRVIGKKRSMLDMIKEKTRSNIVVGQNGRIWIKGENVDFIVKVMRKIEAEAQTSGLTDRISGMLDEYQAKEV